MPRTLTDRMRGSTQTRQTHTQFHRRAELRAAQRMRSGDGTPRALGGGALRRPSPGEAGLGAQRGPGAGVRAPGLAAGAGGRAPGAGAGRGPGQGQGGGQVGDRAIAWEELATVRGYVRNKAPGEKGDCGRSSAGTVGLLEGSRSRLGGASVLEARPRVASPRLRAKGPPKVLGLCGRASWICGSLRDKQGLALAVPHAWKALPCPYQGCFPPILLARGAGGTLPSEISLTSLEEAPGSHSNLSPAS